jgi:hypothetical protein
MNPLFRQIIYDIPLCEGDDISKPSNFIEAGQMYDILMAVQKLFVNLDKYNVRAISTKTLTEAFEWSGSDGSVQHDSQEFFRLFFESLDGILSTTSFNGICNNLFRVVTTSFRTCSNCNFIKSSDEYNLDITLIAKGSTGLVDSLENYFNNYEIINDYKCDECNQRVDLKRGNKISQLPLVLTCVISKMDYDFNKDERVKITSKYDFPLELNVASYMTLGLVHDGLDPEEFEYELYAIIIHKGNPYFGHYFSYIRDLNEDGEWNLNPLYEFRSEPEKREDKVEKDEKKEEEKSNKNDILVETIEKEEGKSVSDDVSATDPAGKAGRGKKNKQKIKPQQGQSNSQNNKPKNKNNNQSKKAKPKNEEECKY